MTVRGLLAAILLAVVFLAQPAKASPADDLKSVVDAHWQAYLRTNPVFASTQGVRSGDGTLEALSLAAFDRTAEEAQGFLDRLQAIPGSGLDDGDRVNKAVLAQLLSEQVEANRFGQRMMLFTSYSSWHQSFADLPDVLPFSSRADYRSWLDRMAAYPRYNDQAMALTRMALAKGFVQPCAALGGFADSIDGITSGALEDTSFFAPFKRTRPVDMVEADWLAFKDEARMLISGRVIPAYQAWGRWFRQSYLPKCRKSVGASALNAGPAYYAFRARAHTTTDLTPQAIHQMGQSEVTRIRARMDDVGKTAGYADGKTMRDAMRGKPASYATDGESLIQRAARQAKEIDGLLPRWFATLPRLPYGVKAIPAAIAPMTTTAYYMPGSAVAGIAGTYFVNTSKLDQRPLWEVPALTAHEAVPGHHLQIARQQELPLPEFRKHAAGFTAYVEGWGLYAEYLGEEMGLYATPEALMGRLSYEMWRASRLVVDTGLHAKGWSKAQAIAFMRENTALSDGNIEAEVNRYISWPGQALGYKLGEVRIRAARARAETTLGPRFDIRAFHDAVLGMGPVPLDVMDAEIDRWMRAQAAKDRTASRP